MTAACCEEELTSSARLRGLGAEVLGQYYMFCWMAGNDEATETLLFDRHELIIDESFAHYEANGAGCEESLPAGIAGLPAPREAVVILFDTRLEKYLVRASPATAS